MSSGLLVGSKEQANTDWGLLPCALSPSLILGGFGKERLSLLFHLVLSTKIEGLFCVKYKNTNSALNLKTMKELVLKARRKKHVLALLCYWLVKQ